MAATIDDRVAELERANAELRRQLDACGAELKEARDQQTATAEVLQVINSAPGDLAPVFDAILEKAHSLCEAPRGGLILYDGEYFRAVAVRGFSGAFADRLRQGMRGSETYFEVPLLAGERFIHISDQAVLEHPNARAGALAGTRTLLSVPLRKGDALLGMIVAGRTEVCPFTDKQVALLENFAAQAVIAMENARLLTETREALEQQTATAEVLQVINSSPGDLAPVFDAMLGKARRLCEAELGLLLIYEGDCFRAVSLHGAPEAYVEFMTREPISPGPNTGLERLVRQQRLVHIADLSAEQAYCERDPLRVASVELAGMRTFLAVPLVKEEALLGAFVLYRQEVRPFTDKQIALLQNFAAQAVIAMENARLITETREALERQTATAEVLQVINSSPGDLAPVFDAMLEKALRLCEAAFGVLRTFDGEFFHVVAVRGEGPFAERVWQLGPIRSDLGLFDRLVAGENVVHTPDVYESDVYGLNAAARERSDAGNIRSCLHVALRKEGVLLGTIIVFRQEVRPFSEKQIALLQNFAAQAVIAMENARLLTETREALEQQTATAEVLQVINSSPGDLAPVFDAMLKKALHLCGAPYGILWNYDGEFFEVAAQRGVPKAFLDTMSGPQRPTSPETTRGRLVAGERVVHITNLGADLLYQSGDQHRRALVDAAGAQVVVAVSLRKDDKLLGAFTIYRQEARPFSDKQIALVTTFADQAVIAMENARLITETREALEQQTATAEVLQVINSSPGDLAPVFDAMIRKAVRLCGAVQGSLRTFDGEALHLAAWHGDPSFAERARELGPIVLRRGHPMEPLLRGQSIVHLTDAREATANSEDSAVRERVAAGNIRSWLAVALRTDGGLLGSIAVSRQEVRPFTDKQIALLQNFAAQAVIAMENARLITETREALEQQTATAEVLQVINSSPGDFAPVFDAILEKATRLCDVPYGSLELYDGERFRAVAVHGLPKAFADTLQQGYPASDNPATRPLIEGSRYAHITDVAETDYSITQSAAELVGARTLLCVPLRRDNALLGMIACARQEVRPFSEKEIALLQNFAAQAVIAMENARLLTETREALDQQTATAEVLQVINSSPGDLAPVFDAMVERAARLCEADEAAFRTFDGELLHLVAVHGSTPDVIARLRQLGPTRAFGLYEPFGRGERVVHIADVRTTDIFRDDPVVRERLELRGIRTWLAVALHKEGVLLGVINVHRHTLRPFTDKQVALLENFAAQAVIAMENARLLTETREALEQQTATAEVLQVINSSPGELAPVFDTMLEKAMRLCDATIGALWTCDGEQFALAALRGGSQELFDIFKKPVKDYDRMSTRARALRGEHVTHILDARESEAYLSGDLYRRAMVDLGGGRSMVTVSLRRDDAVLGIFTIYRREVRAFSNKQISLLQNFAAQAVIAMENARLMNETREALEQQTATAEVLQVINSSPGDLTPVFDAMLEKAMRLCEAAFGMFWTYDGVRFEAAALRGVPGAFAEFLREPPRAFHRETGLGRMLRGERVTIHVDMAAEEAYRAGDPLRRAIVDLGGAHSAATVALRKDDTLLGAFTVFRQEVRPFTDKQIALLQNFAAQAVIAMENARLLTETREALEQQTATAEVLQVINSSPGDLAPVFDAMLDRAMRLCGVDHAALELYDGERMRAVAVHGASDKFAETLRQGYPATESPASQTLLEGGSFVEIADAAQIDHVAFRTAAAVDGIRTVLFVPLQRDDIFLGMIASARREVRPFSEKEIALLQNFAAQAVIAMENARLITETREALEQQTATAEVLQVINSSPGDLAPVFDAMLDRAIRLCEATHGHVFTYDGDCFHPAAVSGERPYIEWSEQVGAVRPGPGTPLARISRGERIVHIADVWEEEFYRSVPAFREQADLRGFRSGIWVALHKDDVLLLGAIIVYRQEVRPFSDRQIALLENFAAQAVIAMENARLITETREALEQQTATAEVLQVINSSPGDLAPVFEAMLDKAVRLCDFAFAALWTYDGTAFHPVALHGMPAGFEAYLREHTPPAFKLLHDSAGPIHLPDVMATEMPQRDPEFARVAQQLGSVRTLLLVPLRKDAGLLGAFVAYRQEVRPFSDKQIALLQNFAAQAVIAMENARLLTETREALEQQTATAEVLQVINSSPGELAPVFDAMLEKAMRLCRIALGALELHENGKFRAVAVRGVSGPLAELLRQPFEPPPESPLARLIAGEQVVQITDMSELARLQPDDPRAQAGAQYGLSTALFVPLRKDAELLGQIAAFRKEALQFSEKETALLQNFAAQAVIAMENARLITETREALEQQTATAEVLQVINSSPGDLAPVFDAILEKAHSFCGAVHGSLHIADADGFRGVAMRGVPEAFADFIKHPFQPGPNHPVCELIGGAPFATVINSPEFDDPIIQSAYKLAGMRTGLFVPLRKDRALRGYIVAARPEIRPFTDKQIALLQNFAAQAVIAMENARLLTETREALEQQTATADVLQVINSSPGDLAPVFDAMLDKALNLCGAAFGILQTIDGKSFHTVAHRGVSPAFADFLAAPREVSATGLIAEFLEGARFVHRDAAAGEGYRSAVPVARAFVELEGARTLLSVPLRKDATLVGWIVIYRREARPFSEKQIALLQNFAAQAVIAMENARLLTETREALEQQTATAEVLQVINSSPGDLAPVFDAVLARSIRLCEASFGVLWTYDGERFHAAALRNVPTPYAEFLTRAPYLPEPEGAHGRLVNGESLIHIVNVADTELYRSGGPLRRALVDLGGARSAVSVALRKDDALLGMVVVYRQEVRPFSDKQIALLQNFAAQAVIAMENARLLTETREALEQQTATAEVLQVINASPGDLAPVFDAMLNKALRLCDAAFGHLLTFDGQRFETVAVHCEPRLVQHVRQRGPILAPRDAASPLGRIVVGGEHFVQIADVLEANEYRTAPNFREMVDLGGYRSLLNVALRKENVLLGVIVIFRKETRLFSDKQIALLQNFAAQAVIAIENARLLGELRQRTGDLEESLEYQTATSDVLRVISGSVFDLEPVLQTVLSRATDLCRSPVAEIFRLHDGGYRWAAGLGVEPEYEEIERRSVIQPGQDTLVGRVALERRMVHVADVLEDPLYGPKQEARLGKFRTMLGVPLLRDDMVIGVIAIARWIVEPYTDKEIRLVTTFADQAVIAIENARLLGELRERTAELGRSVEELKMLGEVGRAVSSTLDLRAVLSTILTASLEMTWATAGAIFRYIRAERAFRLVEAVGWDEALLGSVGDLSIAETETLMSEAALSRTPIQLTDLAELPSTRLRDASLAAGLRSVLIVPLVGPERIFGALVLQRREAGEFPAETVRLMQTLASQSVLAIQNARLFREIADKSEQLALASQHKSQFLANMSHELRTPLNAILGYAELLVDGIYGVLPEKAQGVLERVQNNGKHLLALINDVLDLAKIEAGQLALTLEDYVLAEVVRSVVTATEPLAAAKALKFTAIVQEGMPMAHGDARRVSQVLLNLAGNAIKFTDAGEVEINASAANGQFVLEVRDTGPGIADADQERIFGEFQQIENTDTRKKGGTGLGLAISKRMVEMQGGMISVESTLARGSTFRVVLPIQVEPAMEAAA